MGLLTKAEREKRFEKLGLGKYSKENILKFQKEAFPKNEKQQDSKYGINTDRALRHFYNVKVCAPSFKPEEFKCECGGKYCTGYPSYMKQVELKHIQAIRHHFGKPMEVTCGLRCETYNSILRGSIENSKHLKGYATDFFMKGVTDTLANRKAAIKWIKTLPNHNYTYGDGINSNGYAVSAGYMGNAIHTDTNEPDHKKTKKVTQYLTQAQLDIWLNALKTQSEWSKNATYAWVEGPTVKNSKTKCTCISLPCVALQRLKIFTSGGYVYFHPQKLKISGNRVSFVKDHPEIFNLSYPNRTVKAMSKDGTLQPGDWCGFGNPSYHTMVYLGMNSKGEPLWASEGHKKGYKIKFPSYYNRKVNMLIRLKKVEK